MSKMPREIRVGIVGGNANAGWTTKLSHVPAIKALPGLRLAAVATRNEHSARAAAEAFGAGTVETAINVGEVYAQLARDLHEGAYRTPGFDHALANARLVESVLAAEWVERRKTETRTGRNAR
jgi:predicted homoserine dehydrogenase-like protein